TGASEPTVETAAQELAKEDVHAVEPSPEAKWEENAQAAQDANPEKFPRLKKLARAYWTKKKWTIPVSIIVLLALLLGVPFTRYPILGLALKKDVPVTVMDSATGQPVTAAMVTADGKTVETDNHGQAVLKLKVGKHSVKISKKYYKDYDSSVFVGIMGNPMLNVAPIATGRQVPITVTDYISGKPLEDAVITASGSSAKTDKNGAATLVLPAKGTDAKATITLSGYNDTPVSVLITSRVATTNKFTITPTGKLYFLSNQSGNINVVKTNLDGKNRKTILAGTGKEDAYSTSLLASRDWKYLALLSKRDGNQGIYLIDTSDDKVTNIDGGNANATFTLVGWGGDTFVYETQRSNVSSWQSGAQVLKSYDAAGGKLYTLDQT
ncbi:MAG: TolB family protein, partial [Candidatus Saccharimonadales bacterium]